MENKKITFINIADLVNEKTGKTYREENMEKTHNIPLGSLVEVQKSGDNDDYDFNKRYAGIRAWVVEHDRDCDGTPLYSLSLDKDWKKDMYGPEFASLAVCARINGFSEDVLKIIK